MERIKHIEKDMGKIESEHKGFRENVEGFKDKIDGKFAEVNKELREVSTRLCVLEATFTHRRRDHA